ncbi:MAG: DUF533 domain-containing protein [Neisseria sp.]|nr:DUF533 domain-containing protein [Neisseria sp.]
MNFSNLLNQVLGAVQQSGNKVMDEKNPLNSFGGGAIIGGLASMLLKKSSAQSLLKTGSAAALGMMAYKAFQNWQGAKQGGTALPETAFAAQGRLAEDRSRVILRTMIAAAAADGLIDDSEKQLIAQEGGADAETGQWLAAEYARPAAIDELAQAVGGDQALAAEAYLAARVVCGDLARSEIVFLSRLAQALNLDDKLVEQLERQLGLAQ